MVMVPTRYPLISGVSNDDLLSRKTDWLDRGQDVLEGTGQRMLATDQSDYPLLQVRSIVLEA
jgi:type VI secretion system protein ImpE